MAEMPKIATPYDPPRIERVLTSEDLAQEVEYAGKVTAADADFAE